MPVTSIIKDSTRNYVLPTMLCKEFNVTGMATEKLTTGDKMKFFLLGASFITREIRGHVYNLMLYENMLYVLSE